MPKLTFGKSCGRCGGMCEKKKAHCPTCQEQVEKEIEQEWQDAEKLMADSLNPVNREKFLSFDMELRRGLILQAIEDGAIHWEIRGSSTPTIKANL